MNDPVKEKDRWVEISPRSLQPESKSPDSRWVEADPRTVLQSAMSRAPEQEPQEQGDFIPGIKRGFQQTQAMLYGAGALAGSGLKKMGAEDVGGWIQDKGMEGYRRNIEEAEQYPKKHTFKDVYTGKAGIGGTVDWMQGTLGELAPSMAEAALGAAIGSFVAPGAGTGVGAFGARTVLKKSIDKLTKEALEAQIQKGIVKQGTEAAVEKEIRGQVTKNALKKLGGKAGMGAAVLPLEAGGSYAGLLEKHGVDAPGTSLFFGALATSLEYAGGNSRLIDVMVDGLAKRNGGVVKKAAKELLTNIPQEAAQEAGQEAFQILNTVVNTDEKFLTPENIEQIIESAGAGAVGGGAGAVAQTVMSREAAQEKEVSDAEKVMLDEEDIGKTPEDILMGDDEGQAASEFTDEQLDAAMGDTAQEIDPEQTAPPAQEAETVQAGAMGQEVLTPRQPPAAPAGQEPDQFSKLDDTQRSFVEKKVQEAGSVEAVDKAYDTDSVVDQFARAKAREAFGEQEPRVENPPLKEPEQTETQTPAAPTETEIPDITRFGYNNDVVKGLKEQHDLTNDAISVIKGAQQNGERITIDEARQQGEQRRLDREKQKEQAFSKEGQEESERQHKERLAAEQTEKNKAYTKQGGENIESGFYRDEGVGVEYEVRVDPKNNRTSIFKKSSDGSYVPYARVDNGTTDDNALAFASNLNSGEIKRIDTADTETEQSLEPGTRVTFKTKKGEVEGTMIGPDKKRPNLFRIRKADGKVTMVSGKNVIGQVEDAKQTPKPSTAGMSPELAYRTEYRHWLENGKKGKRPLVPGYLPNHALENIQKSVERDLQYDRERQRENQSTKSIGTNPEGKAVFVDENGVRSYQEGNVRSKQPVSLTHTRAGVKTDSDNAKALYDKGRTDYLTTDEIEGFKKADRLKQAEAEMPEGQLTAVEGKAKAPTKEAAVVDVFTSNMMLDLKKNAEKEGRIYTNDQLETQEAAFRKAANDLVESVQSKDFQSLEDRLHRGNPESLRLFRVLTGKSTSNQEDIKASIRSLDPKAYDAWDKARKEAANREKAAKEAAEAKKAREEMVNRPVNDRYSDETWGQWVNRLIEEGHELTEEKRGFATVLSLSKGNNTYSFKTKQEQEYVQEQYDKLSSEQIRKDMDEEDRDMQENPDKYITKEQEDHLFGKKPKADPISEFIQKAQKELPEGLTIVKEQNNIGEPYISVLKEGKVYNDINGFGYTESGVNEAVRLAKYHHGQETKAKQVTPESKEETPAKPDGYGKKNKVFTEDAAAKARELLRKKFKTQLNAGLDPEMVQAGITLAGYHIEAGARTFIEYSKAMIADLGAGVKPYLRSFYEGARYFPGMDQKGMTDGQAIDKIDLDKELASTNIEGVQNEDNAGRPGIQDVDTEGDQEVSGGRGGAVAGGRGDRNPTEPRGTLEVSPTEDVPQAETPGDIETDGIRSGVQDAGDSGQVPGRGDAGERRPDGGVEGMVDERPGGTGRSRLGNYHIEDPKLLIGGTPKKRFAKNQQAIEIYNELLDENRDPTSAEKDILAGYIGWGSFGQELFQGTWNNPTERDGWVKENQWLREHLGKEDWESAQRSIINAHYTDPPTVTAVWDILKKMGFKGGRVLEPSAGVGNFFGLMPKDLKQSSDLTGIELDNTTAGIAKMLYPNANIQQMGYQDSKTADNFYDVVVGNWPFAKDGPADRRYNKFRLSLHDYFFVKALDQVRPGGFVVGITSSGTMDKKSKVARLQMDKRADLVAAFRMPSGAFKEYAGTSVVADLIVFQKRKEGTTPNHHGAWGESVPMLDNNGRPVKATDGKAIFVNEYWAEHPNNVLGEMTVGHGTTQGREGMIVNRKNNYGNVLSSIAERIPEKIMTPRTDVDHVRYISNNTTERQNSVTITKDGLYVVRGERLANLNDVVKYEVKDEEKTADRTEQIKSLVGIRDAYGKLLDSERLGHDGVEDLRKELKTLYDAFVKKHGSINESYGIKIFNKINDPLAPALIALEINVGAKKKPKFEPSKIFTESTQRTKPAMENPTIAEAFVLDRNENALYVDLESIAEKANSTVEKVKAELTKNNAIFETPAGVFEVADVYLSGNVKQKLREAKAAQASGKDLSNNIKELEKVIPEDTPYFQIEVGVGATWVPQEVYQDFIGDLGNLPQDVKDTIRLTPSINGWIVKFDNPGLLNNRQDVRTMWVTEGSSFTKVVSAAFTGSTIKIMSRDSDGNSYLDTEKSLRANEKVDEIRTRFKDWIWADVDRRVAMEKQFNEVINAFATPNYDGSFLNFDGMALQIGENEFNLRQHQVNGIWRGIVNGRGLYAHEVGTGKTFTMAGIAVESRRYGLAKKPLILAHNANSESVAKDINVMYPGANVLYIDNLSPQTIDSKLYQIANDDWDAIVMPHSIMDRLTLSEETLNRISAEEIAALEADAIESAAEEGFDIEGILDDEVALRKIRGATTAKELVKQRNRIIETIQKQAQRSSRENAITFESLGIDMIIVDEAHIFKKPPLSTRMRVKGLNTEATASSIGLHFLTSYIKEINNGKGVFTFTGTPITNTLNEVFNQMRYVMSDKMEDAGIDTWDAWFNTFADVESDIEITAAGDYQTVTRLTEFNNVPELRRFSGQYMDIVFADDMPEFKPRPTDSGKTMKDKDLTKTEKDELLNGRVDDGEPIGRPYKKIQNEVADMSPDQEEILRDVMERALSFRQADGQERYNIMRSGDRRNPVVVEGDAAKAGFDARLYDRMLPDHPNNKINRSVKNIMEHYLEHEKSAQVVFMEKGFNDTVKRTKTRDGIKTSTTHQVFNAAKELIDKLVEAGIPREQIAIVDGKTTKKKRQEIADAVNKAEIRVVIGQTSTLGTGVNMQENLRAMHHLDAPWMPGELEQRNGRGHRQGNRWNTVMEYRYITNRIDGKRWQVLAKKQRMIQNFLKAKEGVRTVSGDALDMNESNELEDITSSFSEAAGDARILIRAKLEKDVEKLLRRERTHDRGIVDAKTNAEKLTRQMPKAEQTAKDTREDSNHYLSQKDNPFSITLEGKTYDKKEDANAAFEKMAIKLSRIPQLNVEEKVGSYLGFEIIAEINAAGQKGVNFVLERKTNVYVKPSINSLNAHLRNLASRSDKFDQEIVDVKSSIEKLKSVSKEKFGQADLLKRKRDQLAQVEADLQAFPDPPPPWLAQGAPIDTDVYIDGKAASVDGHRAGEHDYYLLVTKEDGTADVISYKEAMDENGIPIYEGVETEQVPTGATPVTEESGTIREGRVQANSRMSQFSTSTDYTPGQGLTTKDIQEFWKGQAVFLSPDGSIAVRLKNGLGVRIELVEHFSKDDIGVAMTTGRMDETGTILGITKGSTIKFNKYLADTFTNSHEPYHFLINAGMLTKGDRQVIKGVANAYRRDGKFLFEWRSDMEENEANAFSQFLNERKQHRGTALGRILQRIADFFDGIWHIGRMSARKLAREKEIGKLFERPGQQPEGGGQRQMFHRLNAKPWPDDFPNATLHTSLAKMKKHPAYKKAKSGDITAAIQVVSDSVKPEKIRALYKKHPDAIVLAPHAEEAAGKNKIPLALAKEMGRYGFQVGLGIVQTNTASRTKKDSVLRLVVRPEFDGPVVDGGKYILIDDAIGQGGTLSELRYFIESNGGEVVHISALTAGIFGAKLPVTAGTIQKIESKFGRKQTEEFLYEHNTAGSLEALTEKEGRAILGFPSLDALRDRIASAGSEAGIRIFRQAPPADQEVTHRKPPSPKYTFAGPEAKGADKSLAFEAQQMRDSGKSRKAIWDKTGWWEIVPGSDVWSWEIDDSMATVDIDALQSLPGRLDLATQYLRDKGLISQKQDIGSPKATEPLRLKALEWADKQIKAGNVPSLPLDQVLNHPDLLDNYPFLKDIKVTRAASPEYAGVFDPDTKTISVTGFVGQDPKGTFLHEVQHAIQDYEGFATGGNLSSFDRDNTLVPIRKSPEIQKIYKEADRLQEQGDIQGALKLYEKADKKAKLLGYSRLTGEVQARLTERRKALKGDKTRKAEPPWITMKYMMWEEGLIPDLETKPEDVLISRYVESVSASVVEDKNELEKLESGKKIKVFRAMQVIDGELYPPMSAKVDGKLRESTKIGQWEKADENPELIKKGNKFKLDKANKSSITAAYNPYFHTSASPLNDQFSSAYKRPNLVTVEVEIPASELASGYKAEGAKDSVGEKKWHSGPVSSKLSAGKKRTVILSRYAKVLRIVPDSEVAETIAKLLEGENVTIPEKVVTPSLRDELQKRGVQIAGPSFSTTSDRKINPRTQKKGFLSDRYKDDLPPEVAARMEKGRQGIQKVSLMQRLKNLAGEMKKERSHFPELSRMADKVKQAITREILRRHQEIPAMSQDRAAREITDIVRELTEEEYNDFSLELILGDEVRAINDGQRTDDNLPFGFQSTGDVIQSFKKIQARNKKNERVAQALAQRRKLQKSLAKDLVRHGIMKKEILRDGDYFHHQILAFWNDQAEDKYRGMGTSSSEVRTKWRPWMAARKGSPLDYNTQYMEAEIAVVAQQISQIETAKNLAQLQRENDILKQLKREAKDANRAAYDRWVKAQEAENDGFQDPVKPHTKKIAMGFSGLAKAIKDGNITYDSEFEDVVRAIQRSDGDMEINHPRLFPFLSHLLEKEHKGAMFAAMVYKGIKGRNDVMKSVLEKNLKTWKSFIPEGYREWKPDPNAGWFWTNSIADEALQKVLTHEASLDDVTIRKILARGNPTVWVIPEGLADTMDNFRPFTSEGRLGRLSETMMSAWKQYILINPLSVVKYNINNMSGDLDVVLAYRPEIAAPKRMTQAVKDLIDWTKFKKLDKGLKAELDEAQKHGVIGSGFAVQEVADTLKMMSMNDFVRDVLREEKPNIAARWWKQSKDLTRIRENMLRLCAFRWFKSQIEKGNRNLYGASKRRDDIDALISQGKTTEAAAKLSRELLGDYGNLSRHGEYLRKHLIPFWSWQEINLPRYVYMMRNLRHEGETTNRLGLVMAKRSAVFAAKASMLAGTVILWNMTMFPDEWDELGEAKRRQLHLIFGRRDDGSIISLRFQGALSDALSWFGKEDLPADLKDIAKGQTTIQEQTSDAGKAVINRLVSGMRPDVKTLFETLTGKSTWPDAFSPRPVRDKVENILQTFKLDMPYRYAMGRPKRGDNVAEHLANDLIGVVLYTTEPGVQAYYDTRKKVFDWKDKHGFESGGGTPTKKGNALYYYRQALKYGDLNAAEKYLKRYYELGGTRPGVQQSMRMAHPLAGIKKTDRYQFRQDLSPKDRKRLEMALNWYRQTYLQRGQ